jgi:hypothetical protein
MSVSEAAAALLTNPVESTELAPGANGFHLEPRCRIRRNDQVRTKVNDLLATGASYAMVLRARRAIDYSSRCGLWSQRSSHEVVYTERDERQ